MAQYGFTFPWVLIDRVTNQPSGDRVDGQSLHPVTREPVPVYDMLGQQVSLRTGPYGIISTFTADVSAGVARFGETETVVISDAGLNATDTALAAAADAKAARDAIELLAGTATEITYLYRDAAGDVWVSETPVIIGGGRPRVDSNGDVWVDFPVA